MEEKDLKKLKRSELLEIMLAQSEEIDRLRAELASRDAELESRRIAIGESGSIAEASLRLTRVFEEAQRAADLYVDNVRSQQGTQRTTQAPSRTNAAPADSTAVLIAGLRKPVTRTRPVDPPTETGTRGRHFGGAQAQ